jgi:hypothetical protein
VPSTSQQRQEERATIVLLDLGFPRVPVDEIRVSSSTARYKRLVRIEGSDDGSTFVPLAESDIARFGAVDLSRVPVRAQQRYLRVTIENGDDPPLASLRVVPEATSRALLLAGGFRPPFRLLYGAADVPAPEYDFAKLPAAATGVARAVSGRLGAETANASFEEPADTRTFFERNDWLVQVLLVAGAVVAAVEASSPSGDGGRALSGRLALRAAEEAALEGLAAAVRLRRIGAVRLRGGPLRREDPDHGVRHRGREAHDDRDVRGEQHQAEELFQSGRRIAACSIDDPAPTRLPGRSSSASCVRDRPRRGRGRGVARRGRVR